MFFLVKLIFVRLLKLLVIWFLYKVLNFKVFTPLGVVFLGENDFLRLLELIFTEERESEGEGGGRKFDWFVRIVYCVEFVGNVSLAD